MILRTIRTALRLIAVFCLSTAVDAGQPLETETARLPPAGAIEFESTVEYQTSPDGNEFAVPLALAYGITDRLELLLEPVIYTRISPDVGNTESGIGDIETTLTYRLNDETARLPAFAIAAEVKIPTASNDVIGTGKADYAAYLIASKLFGNWDLHLNANYTVLGQPSGTSVSDTYGGAVALEYHASPDWDFVGEYIATSSSTGEVPDSGAPAPTGESVSEAAGGESFAMLGMRYRIRENAQFALGVSYDNNSAWLIRPGITFKFR